MSFNSYSFIDPTGPTQVLYLIKIFQENLRRYYQLRNIFHGVRGSHKLLQRVNAGLDNVLGVLVELPIKDQKILSDLKNYREALRKIERLYGIVPKSKEAMLQKVHDRTVGESLKMISQVLKYTETQEKNATKLIKRASVASPKGAAKMNVEVNSAILHSLNQLIKINGQMLKIQAETLAMGNKSSKEHVNYLIKMERDFKKGVKVLNREDFKMTRFD